MPETDLDALLAAAIAHHQAGRLDQAAPIYRQVLAAHPDHAKANHLLGAVLVAQGRPQDGVGLLGRAADLDPGQPNYRYSHGVVLQMLGDGDGAEAAYAATLRAAPDHAQAHNNLGILAQAGGRLEQAIAHFRRVTELAPALAAGKFNLANALADRDDRTAAIAAYRQAAALDPARVEILYNLAATLRQDGQLEAAAETFAQILAREPGHVQARAQLAFLRQHFADWSQLALLERELVQPALAAPPERAVSPFLFLALPIDLPPATLRALAGKMQARWPAGPPLAHNDRSRRARLRIGYVSADFFDHATAHLTRSLFARHDRSAVEVFGYALGGAPQDDPYRRDIANGCDHFVDLGFLSARAAAERIAADKIDILIDLKGHTQANRLGLFAHRPAPIQVTWLGFPGTTGLDVIDYALVDKIVAPPEHQPHYSEKLVWLPDTYQVNDDTQPIAATTPTRAQCGLPEAGFVFCCFNAVSKIEPAIFSVWMRILTQVPGSVLWLLADQPRAQDNLRREAAARGVDPARLVFAAKLPKDAHLARHRHADLFLDTFFYNAHTTASDALWAGVPVLTCPGQTFARRVAASLLTAIGLPELIARDLPAYEALATRLAREPAMLRDLRARLAANRTRAPLFDTARFARHLESAYRLMWARFERGEAPAPIEVPPLQTGTTATAPAAADARLATALRAAESGDGARAAALCQQILAAQPDNAQALHLLATIEANAGHLPAALALAERAVATAPADADHHYLRAVLLQMQGDGAAAAACYEHVLHIAPDHASAHNNLGVVHQAAGRHEIAAHHFREVARLAPDLAAGHFNLANALDELGDKEGAIACLRRAIAIEPNRIEFQYNLATALRHVGDLEGARDGYEKARQLDPTHLSTMAQLALVRLQLCDWRGIDRLRDDLVRPALSTQGPRAATPFVFLVLPVEIASHELRRLAANYGARHAVPPARRLPSPSDRQRPRLRIGYVSADFRNHATAHLMRSLFARHDRAAVEIIGYSLGLSTRDSTYRQAIEQGCDRFVDLGFDQPDAAARRIYQDGIDILVDLKGHTQDNRIGLFAFRPAPVQVTWLGYPGTTGVDFFDYALVDKIVAPEADQPHFSEKLVWLPECYQVNDDTQPIATETPTRAECGLPEQGFVFCSFNAAYKVEPVIFDVWMRILAEVPGSVLWLFPGSLPTQAYLRREAQARGIDPQRLVFAPHRRKDQHLARHAHADLFLDTYFCNAHTTASDSLWAGVPVLTCPGPTFARRVAASLLTALDLRELIAPDLAAYERRAIALARDPAALAALRQRLAASRDSGPLFDTTRFARHLERAYRMMWEIYERGEAPRPFAVPALPPAPRRQSTSAA